MEIGRSLKVMRGTLQLDRRRLRHAITRLPYSANILHNTLFPSRNSVCIILWQDGNKYP